MVADKRRHCGRSGSMYTCIRVRDYAACPKRSAIIEPCVHFHIVYVAHVFVMCVHTAAIVVDWAAIYILFLPV